ncbi:MAG: hypothetical protein KJ871_15260 [Alphaproteobacteria bacterium]|nr:hypothetical protein [Alphaproteobacteria bacterium]MBU2085540.1 hypothetical protein [Alphaproteobacteria bacterium]MBU2141710.1 hypothetical protein [Alphaproteobacteria bacterium]MBU2197673.1 hypothetical protein [Alphaproteobacteria bacterium]
MFGRDDPPSLEPIKSASIRWIIEAAIAEGNRVSVIAPWTRALVAHMRDPLSAALRQTVAKRFPALTHFAEPDTPHDRAHEGYIETGFSVAFPVTD